MASFLKLLPVLSRHGGPKNVVEVVPDALMRSGSILDQDVVAGPSVEDVLPRPADQDVVAGAAKEGVVACAANQHVVAITTVRSQLRVVMEKTGCTRQAEVVALLANLTLDRGSTAN